MENKNARPITEDMLKKYGEAYLSDDKKQILTGIFTTSDFKNLSLDPIALKDMQFKFSHDIKTMSCTNQRSSGRCWLFAAANLLREIIGKKKNIEQFELSQSYLAFWDKFERCNYFLESIIDTACLPTDDRTVSHILRTGVEDGGQWDMFVNIVNKYGIVPKDAMPETYQSSSTGAMNTYINRYLKRVACDIRDILKECSSDESREKAEEIKSAALDNIYSFLCECYTLPPEKFDFEYIDRDGAYHIERDYTPISYRDEMIGAMLDDYVSIINAPTADKPYNRVYTVAYLGNVVGGGMIRHLNLTQEEFKAAVLAQLKDGEIVWFGSDCGKCGERDKRIWDDRSFNGARLTGLDSVMTKAESLDYGVSAMNHAMVFTGVNLDGDIPTRWKIENSWGSEGVNGGYYVASDSWFDLYVYQAVVHKKYLCEKAELYNGEIIRLDPWDPMGSLAD